MIIINYTIIINQFLIYDYYIYKRLTNIYYNKALLC